MKEKKVEHVVDSATETKETKLKTEVVEEKPKRTRKTRKKLKKEDLYLQVNGMQYDIGKYIGKIKETHPDMKELQVYVKPEDHMVYYVADNVHGKIHLE